ncbi:hypothetical protein B9Z55_021566 [Caenorhabditis nigoni]|uniref:Uncharacterized protein n=1 Tax=Caenorhabditis nigoni TaxID=1611254 RepID=A0A2G5TSN5_9PELO|nr:hypothetical protein B9Z55_021566 [Caenorhabditis nigoni]
MSEISESTELIEDEKSDILKKNVMGKSKNWDNEAYLVSVILLFFLSCVIQTFFAVVDMFRHVELIHNTNFIGFVLMYFEVYNLILFFQLQ